MKKFFLSLFVFFHFCLNAFATKTPPVNCAGLPGCPDDDVVSTPSSSNISTAKEATEFLAVSTATLIKYVAVIAVISLMMGGIMYMLSAGKDDKIKKAKSWIIWSLLGVFFSVSAWFIINTINQFRIP